ncbi:MAG: DNA polymerase III subunit alpha [Flavobacteriales bacterium TMED191]|nr:MAG: DNA polymerase III subunit alpha [Flavobacteriales bacterium TMED191]
MTSRTTSKIPFVGLHAHSVAGSPFDALGYPPEHMDFAHDNGMDALALTDHGNMNGLAWQVLHAKKMKKAGKEFKPIFGCEAYFIPSVAKWKEEYEEIKQASKKKSDYEADNSGTTVEDEGASKKKIKSVLNRRRHLILLAMNQTGLQNIFKMISRSYSGDNFYRYPRVDYALLKKHSEGVIAASACLGGVYAGNYWENRDTGPDAILAAMRKTTQKMQEIFGDRWYGELQWNNVPEQHELNRYIIQMHQEFGVDLISTADSHYYNADVWKDRELYKRLGWLGKGKPDYLSDELPISVEEIGYELYPKNGDQMFESYKKYSKECGAEYDDDLVLNSIIKTHQIAHERIETFLPDNTVRLPDFVVPEGSTAGQTLAALCVEGLRSLCLHTNQEYVHRLKHEVSVIEERGFSKYFLTMKSIADVAVDKQLVGAGRGSAAGSLVAYVLNITQVDPIKYGLQFERFLTKGGSGYPDIDYDVSDPMVLKEVLIDQWGDNSVVPITNWNTLQLRSLIKDISKFYGIEFTEVNNVTSKMVYEATPRAKAKHGITSGVYAPTFEELMEFSESLQAFLVKHPDIKTHIEKLYGQTRSASRHAGGVVVGENLDEWMPLINSGGVRQTPWSEGMNVRHLEPMGFIKFDILGLASLRMLEGAIERILKRHHGMQNPTFSDIKEFYDKNLHPEKIDLEDRSVWENIFHKGKWAGIFQFTETGAQSFCKNARPDNIIDLSAITSIYRPGPLGAGVDRKYIGAKSNPEDVEYINKHVREVTEETYGFLIFQEQIAMLAHKLGKDLTLDEGNKLRKLLTKKGTGEIQVEKDKIFDKFKRGCVEKGMKDYEARELWETFEYFSGYGFNKSHAVSYCVLSYQCAYLLNYYPAEWLAAFLDKEPETRKERAIATAKSLGYNVEPLNINTSGVNWEISKDGKTLIQPLSSIKGLGIKAIEQIIEHRPFNTVEDFLFHDKITYSKLNKKSISALCLAQALSCLMDDRFSGLKHFFSAVAEDRPRKEKNLIENIQKYEPEGDFSEEEKLEYLVNLTGVFPINAVVTPRVRQKLDELYIPPISEFDPELGVTWFIPRECKLKKSKNGKNFYVVKVIDDNNEMTVIRCWGVDPERDIVQLNRPYMARLNYNQQWGFSTFSMRKMFKLLA